MSDITNPAADFENAHKALTWLDQLASGISLTRDGHGQVAEAVNLIRLALAQGEKMVSDIKAKVAQK